ncbi:MAG: hypothetical protein Q9217_004522 [Psora testacea]
MAQVAGGSQSPVDLFYTPLSDDTPFNDELYANLVNYADNDFSDEKTCEDVVENAIASSADIHPATHMQLVRLTEGAEGSPVSVKRQSQEACTAVDLHPLGNITSQSQTASPTSHIDRPVSLHPIKPLPSPSSGPCKCHTTRPSSLRHEYQPLRQADAETKPCQAIPPGISGIESWSEQSVNPFESQRRPTTQKRLPVYQLERSYSPEEHAQSCGESSERSSMHLQHASDITENNTIRCSPQVPREQYTSHPMVSSHCGNGPIDGLGTPYSLSTGCQHFSPFHNTPRQLSLPCTTTTSDSTLTPIVCASPKATSNRTTYASKKCSMGPLQSKHEQPSPMSRSLPRLHDVTINGSQHSPRYQTMTVVGRNASQDKALFECLVTAMREMTVPEDNPGVLDTWQKLMNEKKAKIESVCRDLVEYIWKAHGQKPEPLGEKPPLYVYETFKRRFDATQKTICKHLLEDPYIVQVVDDPIHCLKRVQNNRRVNQQKKEAIDEGRKRLGLKVQGKEIALRPACISEGHSGRDDDNKAFAIQPSSEQSSEYLPPSRSQRPRRAATKRAYVLCDLGKRDEHPKHDRRPRKKAKRQPCSSHHLAAGGLTIDSPTIQDSSGSDNKCYSSSPVSAQHVAYAPATSWPSPGSHFSPINPNTHFNHGLRNPQNDQDAGYIYDGFPAQTRSSVLPVSPARDSSFLDGFNPHDYQSHASFAYSTEIDTDEAADSDHKDLPYDPFSS